VDYTYIGAWGIKMKMKKYITVLCVLFIGFTYGQQQTLYTNYLLNQYLYNPAYAGVVEGTQFNIGYRNQWVGFDGAPKTLILTGYGTVKKKPNMAIGGVLTTEKIGLLQRTTFYGTYTYHLKINKKAAINFGLGLGGIQHKVRIYDSRPYDKDDSYLGSDVLNGFAFDANAGFYFYTKNFFLGFSDQQMPNSKILWANSIGRNTTSFYAYTGYNFSIDSKKEWVIQPSVLVRTNSPAPYQFEFDLRAIYSDMIWLGLSYRQKSSTCFMLGCKVNKQFTFVYSYDYTLTNINNYSSGSHEIMFAYLIPFKKKKSKSELVKDADEEELNKIDNTLKTNLRNKKKKETEKKTENKTDGEAPKANEPEPEKTKAPETEIKKENETGNESGTKTEPKAEPATDIKTEPVTEPKTEIKKEAEPKK
jgi:type IX secretion system PorP/SprF family membrane protein